MSYYLSYTNKETYINNEEGPIVKVVQSGNWGGVKSFFKVYKNDTLILLCSFYSFLFTTKIVVEENYTDNIIKFKKRGGVFCLYFKDDYYSFKRYPLLSIIKGSPVFKFLKNNIKVGDIFSLKKVSFGGGILFKVDFIIEEESNIYQIISFIVLDQQSLFR